MIMKISKIFSAMLILTLFSSGITSSAQTEIPEYITRIQAVEVLLGNVIKAASGSFPNWDIYYIENDKYGGYDLKQDNSAAVSFVYDLFPYLTALHFSDISDLASHDKVALALASSMNFIYGYGDGTFRPNDDLTYAQALSMFKNLPYLGYNYYLNAPYDNAMYLTDFGLLKGRESDNRPISKSDFTDAIKTLINGRYPDTQYVSRIQSVDMLLDAVVHMSSQDSNYISWDDCYTDDKNSGYQLQMKSGTAYPLVYALYPKLDALPFFDITGLPRRERIALSLAVRMNLITGFDDGTFRPNDCITYQQTIRMLACTPLLGDYTKALTLLGWDGQGDGFEFIAFQYGIKDYGALSEWSKYHKPDDPMKKGDFQASLLMLNDIHAHSAIYSMFKKPDSMLECVTLLAKEACDIKNYYMQYPLCDQGFIIGRDLKRGSPVLGTNASFIKYEITERPEDTNGYYFGYQVKLYYGANTNAIYEPTIRYVYVASVDGEYKILQVY